MRLLLAEDEKALSKALVAILERNNYSVDAVYDGQSALDYLEMDNYDGVILDIMMPKVDGLTVLRKVREKGNLIPILLLTAKSEVDDKVEGLDAGANDYLVKPFAFEELLARVRVLLRKPSEVQNSCYQAGDLEVHVDSHEVFRGGKKITLSGKEFALLRYMIQNQGIVLSREKLEQHIWNYDYTGGSNVIDVYIRYLRKKIDEGQETKLIHTVRGAGYVLKAEL